MLLTKLFSILQFFLLSLFLYSLYKKFLVEKNWQGKLIYLYLLLILIFCFSPDSSFCEPEEILPEGMERGWGPNGKIMVSADMNWFQRNAFIIIKTNLFLCCTLYFWGEWMGRYPGDIGNGGFEHFLFPKPKP